MCQKFASLHHQSVAVPTQTSSSSRRLFPRRPRVKTLAHCQNKQALTGRPTSFYTLCRPIGPTCSIKNPHIIGQGLEKTFLPLGGGPRLAVALVAAAALVVPTAVLCTPLHPTTPDLLPLLPYPPLRCAAPGCGAALNPFSCVHHASARWSCPFCGAAANPFPRRLAPDALPAELFPTHFSVEYALPPDPAEGGGAGPGPLAIVFVVDTATAGAELAALKAEVLRVVQGLPEGVRVALVTFAASVWVHDLGFEGCARVVVINEERELESDKVDEF